MDDSDYRLNNTMQIKSFIYQNIYEMKITKVTHIRPLMKVSARHHNSFAVCNRRTNVIRLPFFFFLSLSVLVALHIVEKMMNTTTTTKKEIPVIICVLLSHSLCVNCWWHFAYRLKMIAFIWARIVYISCSLDQLLF